MTQAGFQDGPSNNNLLTYWSSRKDWPKKMALSKSYIDSWCASNYFGRHSWKQQFYMCSTQWQPTPVLLPGKLQRDLVGYSPWGREESDMTERLHFHALEKEMATHSSVLAWRIPGTEGPCGLPSMGSHRVRQDWSNLAAAPLRYGWMARVKWGNICKCASPIVGAHFQLRISPLLLDVIMV